MPAAPAAYCEHHCAWRAMTQRVRTHSEPQLLELRDARIPFWELAHEDPSPHAVPVLRVLEMTTSDSHQPRFGNKHRSQAQL